MIRSLRPEDRANFEGRPSRHGDEAVRRAKAARLRAEHGRRSLEARRRTEDDRSCPRHPDGPRLTEQRGRIVCGAYAPKWRSTVHVYCGLVLRKAARS